MSRKVLLSAAAIAVAGAAAVSLASAAAPTSILWAGQVSTATVTKSGSTTTVAVPNSASLAWFTDRPVRRAGNTTVKGFAANWKQWGFTADPPNAAIAIGSGRSRKTYVVTLTRPRTTSTTTSFRARPVPTGRVMGMPNMGTLPRGTFRNAGLFIDGGAACGYQGTPLSAGTDCEGLTYTTYTVSAPARGTLRSVTVCEDDSNRAPTSISALGGGVVWNATPPTCAIGPAPQYSFGADGGATVSPTYFTTHIYVRDAVIPCANPIVASPNGCMAKANTTYSIAPSSAARAWVMPCLPPGATSGATAVDHLFNGSSGGAVTPPACGSVDGQPSALVGDAAQNAAIPVYDGVTTAMRTANQDILVTYSG
jgi:hypothetical protein